MQASTSRISSLGRWACLLIAALSTTAAIAQSEKATVTGGKQADETYYRWEVTNRYASPIVRIEFPQFGADIFEIPHMWTQGSIKEMNLVNVGWDYRNPGVCFAEPEPPYKGLPRGSRAKFAMRNAPGARNVPSLGAVHIVFADQTTCDIANVELPTQVKEASPVGMLLGVVGLFVLVIVVREVRRRRAAGAATESESTSEP